MNKKIIIGILAAVVVSAGGVFAVVNMNKDEASTTFTDANVPQANNSINDDPIDVAAVEASAATTIAFTNDGFSPGSLTVKKGTVVTVKNDSSAKVQFSSDDHPSHRLNTEMNLKTLAAGESATFTAETVGTHGFHDHIDDSKTGTLVVTE